MTGIKNAEQICLERLPKLVTRKLLDRLAVYAHTGVVYQNIQAAENAFAYLFATGK